MEAFVKKIIDNIEFRIIISGNYFSERSRYNDSPFGVQAVIIFSRESWHVSSTFYHYLPLNIR